MDIFISLSGHFYFSEWTFLFHQVDIFISLSGHIHLSEWTYFCFRVDISISLNVLFYGWMGGMGVNPHHLTAHERTEDQIVLRFPVINDNVGGGTRPDFQGF